VGKRIVYSHRAYADIERIVEFNDRRNQSTAYSRKFLIGLKNRLLKLSKHPSSGIKTDVAGVLLLIWDNYYVFYQLQENTIEIAAIYHQKEDVIR
jgi:plasmid stabilization system protein ParE